MKWVDLWENLVLENVINNALSINHIPVKIYIADILTKECKDVTEYMKKLNLDTFFCCLFVFVCVCMCYSKL